MQLALISILFISIQFITYGQKLHITLKNNDHKEKHTKDQLLRLIDQYDITGLIYTDSIVIDSSPFTKPSSHPVLTLNTRHIRDDELLLSTFIHEQFHWYINDHPEKDEIYSVLEKDYPVILHRFPKGSGGKVDTRYHILICYLEFRALQRALGELKAWQIISFWEQDHYTWVYKVVRENTSSLEALCRTYKL